MIRFRRLFSSTTDSDRAVLNSVLDIFRRAFPYYEQYATRIAGFLTGGSGRNYEVMLLVAEGRKARVLGFTLTFFFPEQRLAFLDYIASDPSRPERGIGAALYEATRELVKLKRGVGLLMDVPTDDASKLRDPADLKINRRRLAFYERYDARPIEGTRYESLTTKANAGFYTFLVHDPLDRPPRLSRAAARKFVERLLEVKAEMAKDEPKVNEIVVSFKDDPVKIREPRYVRVPPANETKRLRTIDIVNVGDGHQIHHLKEKGYVERPARVEVIMKSLAQVPFTHHAVRRYGMGPLRAVHDKGLINYLAQAKRMLAPGKLIYPNVFPIRRPDRIPRTWEMRGGYYCIDTFTPVTSTAFLAAKNAVNGSLTGADLIIDGSRLVYVASRPPGHHAERKSFGGFCYFNNAAIAANQLSSHGRVALIDIDYHHGNGSQEIFYQRKDVYVLSIHGHPSQAYPYFAGYADEKGEGEGLGFNRNMPLYPGVDDGRYLQVLDDALRHIQRFRPDILVVSLGLDTMRGDPTGSFLLSAQGIGAVGKKLGQLKLPTLVVQEGGYSLRNLRLGVRSFLLGLSESMF